MACVVACSEPVVSAILVNNLPVVCIDYGTVRVRSWHNVGDPASSRRRRLCRTRGILPATQRTKIEQEKGIKAAGEDAEGKG